MGTVAIVMTAYNGEKYVGAQIESILDSSYQDFELFIYDDGSTDSTPDILKRYESEYPSKVHIYRNERNLGVTLNFLEGLTKTTSDYIMFCDQDDVWKTNKIAITLKRMRQLEAQTGKDIPLAVFTDACVVDTDLNELFCSFFCSNHMNPRKTDLAHLLMENKLIGCTVMINSMVRKILQSNRLPENAKFHDWWVAIIAASLGRISFVNERTLLYRQHGNNIVGGGGFLCYAKNRLGAFRLQRDAIIRLEAQAEEFLNLYGVMLPEDKKVLIETFSQLHDCGYFKRRWLIIEKGYLKSGLIRNVGLLIII